jgi:hypothetical protein
MMSTVPDRKTPNAASPAYATGSRAPTAPRVTQPLSLDMEPRKSDHRELRNPDPYNTSGSFDRTKNWARIGKR